MQYGNSITYRHSKRSGRKREIFFDRFINEIKVDKLRLDTKTASIEMEKFYTNAINGNIENLFLQIKSFSNEYFIPKIILDFLEILKGNFPNKLAFDYNGSEVLVWAEIADDDFELEKKTDFS